MIRPIRSLLFCSVALAAVAALLLSSCDQKPPPKPAEKKEKKKSLGSPDVRFTEARTQFIDGQYGEAAEGLAKTAEEPNVRPLLLDWIQLFQGMALIMSGKEPDARPVFAKIEERGQFPKGSNDPELAAFMVKLAHLLRGADPAPTDASANYEKNNYQGIGLLALGLKDWSLEKYEEAGSFFRQFNDVAPEKQVDWADGPPDLQKLKALANNFTNDYEAFAPARKALDEAADKSLDEQHDAVVLAQKARAQMKLTTKLSKSLDDTLAVMGPKVASAMDARAKASADEIAADEKAMTDAKQKRNDLMSKFLFTEAKAAISDPNFKTEKMKDEQEVLVQKTAWLANFKDTLIEDLNKAGYSKTVNNKEGKALPGTISKADEQQVIMGAPKAPVPVPWAEISSDSEYEMGLSFIKPDMAPEITAFHKWHLGVFAFYSGKTKEGLDLMHAAAQIRDVFKDALPIFEKASGPY